MMQKDCRCFFLIFQQSLVSHHSSIHNFGISIEDTKQITIEINVFLILASRGVF